MPSYTERLWNSRRVVSCSIWPNRTVKRKTVPSKTTRRRRAYFPRRPRASKMIFRNFHRDIVPDTRGGRKTKNDVHKKYTVYYARAASGSIFNVVSVSNTDRIDKKNLPCTPPAPVNSAKRTTYTHKHDRVHATIIVVDRVWCGGIRLG